MERAIVGMLAETFIHSGSGQSMGAVDLPVAREAATDYPFVPGSGMKGAFRAASDEGDRDALFGSQNRAGAVLVSDARLLLLPVRSLNTSYCWLTCPHLLERLRRDCARIMGVDVGFETPAVADGTALYSGSVEYGLFLEERRFSVIGAPADSVVKALSVLLPDAVAARMPGQLTVVSDGDFSWFARYGLAVNARNDLDEDKVSKNLWYEETLPPDTVLYLLLSGRSETTVNLSGLKERFRYLQVGGNETVGQGWFQLVWRGM